NKMVMFNYVESYSRSPKLRRFNTEITGFEAAIYPTRMGSGMRISQTCSIDTRPRERQEGDDAPSVVSRSPERRNHLPPWRLASLLHVHREQVPSPRRRASDKARASLACDLTTDDDVESVGRVQREPQLRTASVRRRLWLSRAPAQPVSVS